METLEKSRSDMCRQRIGIIKKDGKTIIAKKYVGIFRDTCFGIIETSESPEHARSSIRKISAYKYMLLNAPVNTKQAYDKEERLRLKRIFPQIEDYKRAIGVI